MIFKLVEQFYGLIVLVTFSTLRTVDLYSSVMLLYCSMIGRDGVGRFVDAADTLGVLTLQAYLHL
jgi:hypothetical protein